MNEMSTNPYYKERKRYLSEENLGDSLNPCPWCKEKPFVFYIAHYNSDERTYYAACFYGGCEVQPFLQIGYADSEALKNAWNERLYIDK